MSFKFNLKKRAKGKFAVRMRSGSMDDKIQAGRQDASYIEKTIPENEWARYGFTSKMTYAEAAEHVRTLNARTKERDLKERKARFKALEREEHLELINSAFLPEAIVIAFEKKLKNDSFSANYEKSKTRFHWKTTMRVIAAIELDPAEWSENKRTILKEVEGFAPSTIAKLISLMNSYGTFYSRKLGQFFEKIAMPRGSEVGRISDKYMEKTGDKTKEAKGVDLLTMKLLKEHTGLLKEEIDWCVVALGFGLRPSEVDLINKRSPDVLIIEKGRVKIYQPKLVSLPRKMRFKEVTIRHPFQAEAMAIIKSSKVLKKPTSKKIKAVLGETYGLYSFRKGYTNIMLDLQEDITRISADLGHSSIDRTWKSYRKRITKDS